MRVMRNAATAIAILAGTVGGVAAATMGLSALLIPASATAVATATPVPSFELAVAPTAIGGRLEVTGDRTGTMTLDEAAGIGGRHEVREGGGVVILPASDAVLSGPDGRVTFRRESGEVARIEFDDLSIYLDPGDCTVTEGAINAEQELMAALIECPNVADVRGRGVVSIAGVVALPIEALRGRDGLPETGGRLELVGTSDATSATLDEAEIFLDVPPDEDGRVTAGAFTEAGGVAVEYDPEAEQFYLTQVSAGESYATGSEPCPITARDLGRISETTSVVRMQFDCLDWIGAEGDVVAVSGTIVVDVIEGLVDVLHP